MWQSFYRLAAALAMVAVAIVWSAISTPRRRPLAKAVGTATNWARRQAHDKIVVDVSSLCPYACSTLLAKAVRSAKNGLAYMIASELARNPDLTSSQRSLQLSLALRTSRRRRSLR